MSDLIDKYLEYRKAIIDDSNSGGNKKEPVLTAKRNFEEALRSCVSPLETDADGLPLLYHAAFYGDEQTVKSILDKVPKFHEADPLAQQALTGAIVGGNESVLRLLCNHGVNINKVDQYGRTQLAIYASIGDLSSCILLIKCGAGYAVNSYRSTPKDIFAYAVESKNEKAEKLRLLNFLSLWAWSKNIKPDLTHIDLTKIDPDIIKKVILIGVTHRYIKISESPELGFNNAFSDMATLLEHARSDPQFDFKSLYLALKHCVDASNKEPDLVETLATVKLLWSQRAGLAIYTLFYSTDRLASLPSPLLESAIQTGIELGVLPEANLPDSSNKTTYT